MFGCAPEILVGRQRVRNGYVQNIRDNWVSSLATIINLYSKLRFSTVGTGIKHKSDIQCLHRQRIIEERILAIRRIQFVKVRKKGAARK